MSSEHTVTITRENSEGEDYELELTVYGTHIPYQRGCGVGNFYGPTPDEMENFEIYRAEDPDGNQIELTRAEEDKVVNDVLEELNQGDE